MTWLLEENAVYLTFMFFSPCVQTNRGVTSLTMKSKHYRWNKNV